jgi:hypothetical protein
MSTGQDILCSECDFTFQSGWNHNTASDSCVCINCATIFSIKGLKSPWGVSNGEICHLYQTIRSKKHRNQPTEIDTGIQVVGLTFIQEAKLESGNKVTFETFTFRLENVSCPYCHKVESLKLSLETGDRCPKCKLGNIQSQGVIEY